VHILITAANSAEAHKLKSALNTENIILGDYHELPAFMLNSGKMITLPNPKSIAYPSEMLTLCLDKQIDTIYPVRHDERVLLNQAELLFSEYGIRIMRQTNELLNQ
jgi:hypothetical protein